METLTTDNSSSGTISGSFNKSFSDTGSSNDVTVNGIGTDANVVAAGGSSFGSGIQKTIEVEGYVANDEAEPLNTGAGTASGGASGSVGTTASANASSTQFVSSFGQAY